MPGLIGRKIGMSNVFNGTGDLIPVTIIKAGPCRIVTIRTLDKDGYSALQLGFGEKKEKNITKPVIGQFKKNNLTPSAFLREFNFSSSEEFKIGDEVKVDLFKEGEKIKVRGKSKGKGFQGVMKRHGFGGGRETHGGKCHRIPGSIGCSAFPSKVFRGKKMPGHYGVARQTVRNLEIVDIRPEQNLILVRGAVPGSKQGCVVIKKVKFSTKA